MQHGVYNQMQSALVWARISLFCCCLFRLCSESAELHVLSHVCSCLFEGKEALPLMINVSALENTSRFSGFYGSLTA